MSTQSQSNVTGIGRRNLKSPVKTEIENENWNSFFYDQLLNNFKNFVIPNSSIEKRFRYTT
jgi:hypothetical protein